MPELPLLRRRPAQPLPPPGRDRAPEEEERAHRRPGREARHPGAQRPLRRGVRSVQEVLRESDVTLETVIPSYFVVSAL